MRKYIQIIIGASIGSCLLPLVATAAETSQDGEWTYSGTNGAWNNADNWEGGVKGYGAGQTISINATKMTAGSFMSINIDDFVIGNVSYFGSCSTASRAFTINGARNDKVITFDAGEGNVAMIHNTSNGSLGVNGTSSGIKLGSSLTVKNSTTFNTGGAAFVNLMGAVSSTDDTVLRVLTFSADTHRIVQGGVISGNIQLVLDGSPATATTHRVNLGNNTASNTYTGGTVVRGGVTVNAFTAGVYSGGDITFDNPGSNGLGGVLVFQSRAANTNLANDIVLNADAKIDYSFAATGALGAYDQQAGGQIMISGNISGAGGLILVGSKGDSVNTENAIHMSGVNNYSGGTEVDGNVFILKNSAGASGTGTGDVTVADGAIIGGSGRIGGSVIMAGAGTLQVGFGTDAGFSIDQGLTLEGDLLITYGDVMGLLVIGGTLDLASYNITFDLSGYSGGEADLISFSNLEGGDSSNFSISGLTGYMFQLDGTGLSLVAVPEPATYSMVMGLAILACVLYRRRRR